MQGRSVLMVTIALLVAACTSGPSSSGPSSREPQQQIQQTKEQGGALATLSDRIKACVAQWEKNGRRDV